VGSLSSFYRHKSQGEPKDDKYLYGLVSEGAFLLRGTIESVLQSQREGKTSIKGNFLENN
jgi:hypothetical protein